MPHDQDHAAHSDFLHRAIELAVQSVGRGGGPFGAVIGLDGRIIAEGANRVTLDHDPTAHAEVVAIRNAGTATGRHHLIGCHLYASCQPCPMCLSAIYWAHIDRVTYAAPQEMAAAAGFDDAFIALDLSRPLAERRVRLAHVQTEIAQRPFDAWRHKSDRTDY